MLKISKWASFMLVIGALVFLSSCGEDDPVPPSAFSYPATTIEVGVAGTLTPSAVTGDAPTFTLTDKGGATFLTIDATTGVISVPMESTTGLYNIVVTATNSAGSSTGAAALTIGVPAAFDPRGESIDWKYLMNQQAGFTLTGLDGVPELPFPSLTLPVGWPTGQETPEVLQTYFILTGIQQLLLEVPGDEACDEGNTTEMIVNNDLSLSSACTAGGPAAIGFSTISYANGGYVFTMLLQFTTDIALAYSIGGATIATFDDPFEARSYSAIQGTVDAYTTPTDFTSEETIQDFTTWATPTVDVVLEIL